MLRSRKITDYFEATFDDLIAERILPFDVHLYFQLSQHVLVFYKAGETPSTPNLKKYQTRGLKKIWIHQDDEAAYRSYLAGVQADPVKAPDAAAPPAAIAAKAVPLPPQTAEGALVVAAMKSETLTPQQKEMVVAKTAQNALLEVAAAKTKEHQYS